MFWCFFLAPIVTVLLGNMLKGNVQKTKRLLNWSLKCEVKQIYLTISQPTSSKVTKNALSREQQKIFKHKAVCRSCGKSVRLPAWPAAVLYVLLQRHYEVNITILILSSSTITVRPPAQRRGQRLGNIVARPTTPLSQFLQDHQNQEDGDEGERVNCRGASWHRPPDSPTVYQTQPQLIPLEKSGWESSGHREFIAHPDSLIYT